MQDGWYKGKSQQYWRPVTYQTSPFPFQVIMITGKYDGDCITCSRSHCDHIDRRPCYHCSSSGQIGRHYQLGSRYRQSDHSPPRIFQENQQSRTHRTEVTLQRDLQSFLSIAAILADPMPVSFTANSSRICRPRGWTLSLAITTKSCSLGPLHSRN